MTGTATALAPRGRPFALPKDPTALTATSGGENVRLGWLLAVTRIYGFPTSIASRADVANHLRSRGIACDQARLSRWENGTAAPSTDVVAAYAAAAPASGHHLAPALVMLENRVRTAAPVTDVDLLRETLDRRFEALSAERLDGVGWLRLSEALVRHPGIYRPAADRELLAVQLLNELMRSTGSQRACRAQAARLLAEAPHTAESMLGALERLMSGTAAPVGVTTIALLGHVDHPYALSLSFRALRSPDPVLAAGGARALAHALASRDLPTETTSRIERTVCDLLQASEPVHELIDVVARFSEAGVERALPLMSRPMRETVALVRRTGEEQPVTAALAVVGSMVSSVVASMVPATSAEPSADEMLHRLVRESLFHGHGARRLSATVTLAASPYRRALARAAIERLGRQSLDLDARLLSALAHWAEPEHAGAIVDYLLETRRPPGLRAAVARTLALTGRSPDVDLSPALTETLEASGRLAAVGLQLAGMEGLNAVEDVARRPGPSRGRARWWLSHGSAIRDDIA